MMAFSTVLFVFMLNVHEGLKRVMRDLVDLFRTMRARRGFMLPGIDTTSVGRRQGVVSNCTT
ncbi:hypothetical protein [Falsiroseomonas sp. HW251]|uniref:hypothetical protein n=1 Tax=Falsiroseomonas sp. HW251 TaxID=3390998 RepID=UPI003D31FE1A